jgi:hypothetical protein
LTFCRYRPGLRGLPEPRETNPRVLDLPFRALEQALEPALAGSSSHEIHSDSPLRRHASPVSTPGNRGSLRPDDASPSHVPPLWFLTTLTGCSTREVASLLHPATSQEFAAFRSPHDQYRPPEGGGHGSRWRVPRNAVHTLRRFPLVDSRTASLRPLPSYRYRHRRNDDQPPDADDAPIRRSGPPRHSAQAHAQAKPTSRPVSLSAPPAPPAHHPKVTRRSAPWPKPPGRTTGSTPPASEWVPGLIECQAEQPITRHCSVDESVVPHRRCQRDDTRSFHGLCSPPRSNELRFDPTVPGRRETADVEPKPNTGGPPCPLGDRSEPQSPGEQPRSLCRFPPAAQPKPSRETPPVGRNQASLPRLFSVGRDPRLCTSTPTLTKASSSSGRCPQSLSETQSRAA